MRRISVKNVRPGMKIARSIYASDGRLLLAAGITLTKNFINRLSSMGIGSLYIEDGLFNADVEVKPVVSEKTRLESVKLMRETFFSVENKRHIDTGSVKRAVASLIDEILKNYGTLINFYEIRTYDDYTFCHSVDVCILSLLAGRTLGYSYEKLKELGIGALLHDIGKVRVKKSVLNKPGKLDPEEFREMQLHPEKGFDILRKHYDIPLLSAHVAYQHQERLDGSGYPRRLSGSKIHEYARVVMVADVFDALTSDRPYRESFPVDWAMKMVNSMAGWALEKDFVEALFLNVAPYPAGSVVKLNTGEIGQVVRGNRKAPFKPVVKVLVGRDMVLLAEPYEVDLSCAQEIQIEKTLSEQEILELKLHLKGDALIFEGVGIF